MSLAGFKASNHPQQTGKRGAVDAVDDRGTDPAFIASLEERFGKFTLDVAASKRNRKATDRRSAAACSSGAPPTPRAAAPSSLGEVGGVGGDNRKASAPRRRSMPIRGAEVKQGKAIK